MTASRPRYTTLVVDIETAPDPEAETLEAYVAAGRTPPADCTSTLGRLSLSPRTGRVVSVGWSLSDESREWTTRIQTAETLDERALVSNALEMIRRALSADAGLVVTFNGAAFDLHFLAVRALALRIGLPDGYLRLLRRNVTSPGLDLFGLLTSWGASLTKGDNLHGWARALGFSVPEDAGHGSEIAGLVAAGNWAAVERHNAVDLEITRDIYELVVDSGLV